MKRAKSLGLIVVKVHRGIDYGGGLSWTTAAANPTDFELAEKSLKGKAISHGTSYGRFFLAVQVPRC
jgi:hypothetical protein